MKTEIKRKVIIQTKSNKQLVFELPADTKTKRYSWYIEHRNKFSKIYITFEKYLSFLWWKYWNWSCEYVLLGELRSKDIKSIQYE